MLVPLEVLILFCLSILLIALIIGYLLHTRNIKKLNKKNNQIIESKEVELNKVNKEKATLSITIESLENDIKDQKSEIERYKSRLETKDYSYNISESIRQLNEQLENSKNKISSLLQGYNDALKNEVNIINKQVKDLEVGKKQEIELKSDILHRVSNYLSNIEELLVYYTKKSVNDQTKTLLLGIKYRIKAIDQLNKFIYSKSTQKKINIKEGIDRIIEILHVVMGVDQSIFHINVAEHYLTPKQFSTFSIILTELIWNSFKHHHNKANLIIEIVIIDKDKKYLDFIFKDNGKGYSEKQIEYFKDENIQYNDQSVNGGLFLIKRCAKRIGKDFKLINTAGAHSEFLIEKLIE